MTNAVTKTKESHYILCYLGMQSKEPAVAQHSKLTTKAHFFAYYFISYSTSSPTCATASAPTTRPRPTAYSTTRAAVRRSGTRPIAAADARKASRTVPRDTSTIRRTLARTQVIHELKLHISSTQVGICKCNKTTTNYYSYVVLRHGFLKKGCLKRKDEGGFFSHILLEALSPEARF